MLVEDDSVAAGLFRAQLSADTETDYDIELVETLEEATTALKGGRPDVVALDLTLPDSGGLETLERVREVASEVPIVVLTGAQEDGLADAVRRRGAQGLLTKGRPGDPVTQLLRDAVTGHNTR